MKVELQALINAAERIGRLFSWQVDGEACDDVYAAQTRAIRELRVALNDAREALSRDDESEAP